MSSPGVVAKVRVIPDPVKIKYSGKLAGGFEITGRVTGRSYRVPGRMMSFIMSRRDWIALCETGYGKQYSEVRK